MAEPTEIHVDTFGWALQTTFVDEDNTAIDLSSASLKKCRLTSPSGVSVDKNAAYDTDGSDGVFEYLVEAGVIDEPGRWSAQFHVTTVTHDLWGRVHTFEVLRNLPSPD